MPGMPYIIKSIVTRKCGSVNHFHYYLCRQLKYSDLTYSDSEDYYFTLTNSLADYKDSVDMQFYFDETDKLYKIKASIVNTDIEDAVSYFVDYFNQLYNTNYGIYYDTEYKWYGDKTNITLQATTVLLEITYEEVDP